MLEPCLSLPVAAEKTTRFTEAVGGNDSGNDGDSEAPHSDNNDTQSNGAASDSDADGEENQEKKRKRSWTAWISKS